MLCRYLMASREECVQKDQAAGKEIADAMKVSDVPHRI